MAIILRRECKGTLCDYWKILNTSYDAITNQTNVILALYINQNAREAGTNNYLDQTTFTFEGELDREGSYLAIKTTEEFINSTDII